MPMTVGTLEAVSQALVHKGACKRTENQRKRERKEEKKNGKKQKADKRKGKRKTKRKRRNTTTTAKTTTATTPSILAQACQNPILSNILGRTKTMSQQHFLSHSPNSWNQEMGKSTHGSFSGLHDLLGKLPHAAEDCASTRFISHPP